MRPNPVLDRVWISDEKGRFMRGYLPADSTLSGLYEGRESSGEAAVCQITLDTCFGCGGTQNTVIFELKTRVDELKTENAYQLRLRDVSYNEKIKELTEKFVQDMEQLKTKIAVCRHHSSALCIQLRAGLMY